MLLTIILFKANTSYAGTGNSNLEKTKNDILIVGGLALGGAVLGLSTLSFVEEPKFHTKNIIGGAAFGIIIGVLIVAYRQVDTKDTMVPDDVAFNTTERLIHHNQIHQRFNQWNERSAFEYRLTF